MIRQEELDGMSNFELETLVTMIITGACITTAQVCARDYCSNPSDIMPIAIENGIGIEAGTRGDRKTDKWVAFDRYHTKVVGHENPYRAICIVLILMKEAENEAK